MWKSSAFGLNAAILLICVVFHTKGDLDSEYKVTQVGESCRKIETVEQSEKMGREERFLFNNFPLLNCSDINEAFVVSHLKEIDDVRHLLIEKIKSRDFSFRILSYLPNVSTLSFKNNRNLRFRPNKNTFSTIRSVTISGSPILSLPVQELESFTNLEQLHIEDVNISSFYTNISFHFPKLRVLSLAHTSLNSINVAWLGKAVNLKRFSLRDVNLSNIPYDLNFLDMSNNLLTEVPERAFRKALELTILILSHNKISVIQRQAFKGTSSLEFIDLSGNLISSLPAGVFDPLVADSFTVELWENPIQCDCRLQWLQTWMETMSKQSTYPSVQLRCTTGNLLSSLGQWLAQDFICPSQTESPTIERQNFTATTNGSEWLSTAVQFQSDFCATGCGCYKEEKDYLPQHRILQDDVAFPLISCTNNSASLFQSHFSKTAVGIHMTNSNMSRLRVSQLERFASAKKLVFSDNCIKVLEPDQKVVLQTVEVLGLHNNEISSITKEFLKSFPSLWKLRLFNNKILHFSDDLFIHNRRLTKLFLGPNPVESNFTGTCLSNLALVHLGLKKLKIWTVPRTVRYMTKLLILDLSENHIASLYNDDFSDCQSLIDLNLENNNLSRIPPGIFSHMRFLENLDLSENSLSIVSEAIFRKRTEQQINVELWQNPLVCDCRLRGFASWVEKVEFNNPSSKIRFQCSAPPRMREKLSDKISVEEYVCTQPSTCAECDSDVIPASDALVTKGGLAAAIVLTALLTICADFLVRKFVRQWVRMKRAPNYSEDQPMVAFDHHFDDESFVK